MFKFLAAAAVAAVAVTGLPTVSEAGHERGERMRIELPRFEHKAAPSDPLFVRAPAQPRTHVRQRIELPRFEHKPAPRDPLFVRAPSKPRPPMHMPRIRMPKLTMPRIHIPKLRMPRISLPRIEHTPAPRDPLFVPRAARTACRRRSSPPLVQVSDGPAGISGREPNKKKARELTALALFLVWRWEFAVPMNI